MILGRRVLETPDSKYKFAENSNSDKVHIGVFDR